jgi:hypothetical protein
MSELIKTQLNFGGFYDTIHDSIVEDAVAFSIDAIDEDNENDWENEDLINFSNWDAYKSEYCKEWVSLLNDKLGTNIVFTAVDSPREYNFTTDKIIAHISIKDTLALFNLIKDNDLKYEVIEMIETRTTAYDGYTPYYNYEDLFKSENRDFLIEIMVEVLLESYIGDTIYVEDFCPIIDNEVTA